MSVDDWEALYLDGVKRAEGHILSTSDVLEALGLNYEFKHIEEPSGIEGAMYFAHYLQDVAFVPYIDIDEGSSI